MTGSTYTHTATVLVLVGILLAGAVKAARENTLAVLLAAWRLNQG